MRRAEDAHHHVVDGGRRGCGKNTIMEGVALGIADIATEETVGNIDRVGTGDSDDGYGSSRGSSHSADIVV